MLPHAPARLSDVYRSDLLGGVGECSREFGHASGAWHVEAIGAEGVGARSAGRCRTAAENGRGEEGVTARGVHVEGVVAHL